MKKILMLGLCAILTLSSMIAYATENNQKDSSISATAVIIIKGEENIKAYEEAGIIRTRPHLRCISPELEGNQLSNNDFSIQGTSIPTDIWDLNQKSRDFTYSFRSYIYSNYKYKPCPDSISSTGYAIYHMFEPDADQEMKVTTYDSDGSYVTSTNLILDDKTAYGLAVKNEPHYFKYTSIKGTTISGTGTVY
ncbi:hypothetical protein [Caldisalinibacter kiritimatiensis]|jgi:hypothetical protein|uniref:Uncharacterized protein n=1 Tax=Caldisalinibacter kiritimatiensis TaxID=1304284 RepID=R1CPA9_9FIRM|nr:hypothetical protein [Caldisalinibacter kiritimatiensis]EOD00491.1 hypothetical protein L21TH_1462 [Caldisalinibacter kiritimatiensis]